MPGFCCTQTLNCSDNTQQTHICKFKERKKPKSINGCGKMVDRKWVMADNAVKREVFSQKNVKTRVFGTPFWKHRVSVAL